MREKLSASRLASLIPALGAIGLARKRSELAQAWTFWEEGEIPLARKLAQDAAAARKAPDEANHLLCLTSFVTGEYRAALEHHRTINGSYRRLADLNELVVEALIHLGAIGEALDFARNRKGISPLIVQRLEKHAARPLKVDLTGVADVPFAEHPLAEYFPAFNATINGQPVTAHVDTGGAFLLMGPDRAAALGIQTVRGGKAAAHLNMMRVDVSHGIADRFELGPAVLHNVPVDVLSTLRGESDLVIFGTNILEQFLATLDYPRRRLLFSNRGDASAGTDHLAMLPAEGVSVPFYLWSDHFMFARGGLGERRNLNFFVDSGLVSLHTDGDGRTRQAAFTSSRENFTKWGFRDTEIKRGFFESRDPLALGPLHEERPLFVVGAAGDTKFGGVRIDGLISHAFLKRFAWTIDFDKRAYRFAEGNGLHP